MAGFGFAGVAEAAVQGVGPGLEGGEAEGMAADAQRPPIGLKRATP